MIGPRLRLPRAAAPAVAACLTLALSPIVSAQEPLPPGSDGQPLPAGHPPVPGQPPAAPTAQPAQAAPAGDSADGAAAGDAAAPESFAEQVARRVMAGESIPTARAQASTEVPKGTIRVRVRGARDEALAGTPVTLHTTSPTGKRSQSVATTDEEGRVTFEGLATMASAAGQSYRVETRSEGGGSYGTPNFQLPPMVGYDVDIRQLPTTTDTRTILASDGIVQVTFKDDRIQVQQRTTLMNLGPQTVVFAGEGVRYRLPDGFTAFDSQAMNAEQSIARADHGFDLQGSLSPGQTTFAWSFDLPVRAREVEIDLPMPFRPVQMRVFVEASDTMDVSIAGFPEASPRELQGRRFLASGVQYDPNTAAPERLEIAIDGIPAQGQYRWVAVLLAAVLALGGIALTWIQGDDSVARKRARDKREAELLERIAEVERQAARDEIGPKFRERETQRLLGELALLFHEEAPQTGATAPHAAPKRTQASATS